MENVTPENLDSCDQLDVLEEASISHRPVRVELKGGGAFTDVCLDVVTEEGADWAVFQEKGKVGVKDIKLVSRGQYH